MTTKIATLGGSSKVVPALGESWSHVPTNRVLLFWQGSQRYANLFKSANRKEDTVPYTITVGNHRTWWLLLSQGRHLDVLTYNTSVAIFEHNMLKQIYYICSRVMAFEMWRLMKMLQMHHLIRDSEQHRVMLGNSHKVMIKN